MSDFGVVVSLDLHGGANASRRFTDALRLFSMAASVGATDSLVMPSQMLAARDLSAEQRRIAGVGAGTVRLSIGLEDSDDLLEDIAQALATTNAGDT
jgi:cystathionine beta-lyase/cystathionine gamma-synthase